MAFPYGFFLIFSVYYKLYTHRPVIEIDLIHEGGVEHEVAAVVPPFYFGRVDRALK